MTEDDNGTSNRLVIEIEEGWQLISGDFKSFYLARIFKMEPSPRWPTRRQKPFIVLAAKEATSESAIEQVMIWLQMGQPAPTDAKAGGP